jgi:uncharacterized lipoprotein YajG
VEKIVSSRRNSVNNNLTKTILTLLGLATLKGCQKPIASSFFKQRQPLLSNKNKIMLHTSSYCLNPNKQ